MNFHARCLCDGPAHRPALVADAARAGIHDPTGTLPLQRRFSRDLDARWKKLRKLIPEAVAHKTSAVNIISHAASIGDDPVRSFQAWIDEAMRQLVLGGTGAWTLGYVRQAGDAGTQRAVQLTRAPLTRAQDRIPQLQTLCVTELQGVIEAVSQQAVRAFGSGLLTEQPTSKIVRSIQHAIDDVGVRRGRLLAQFFVVRAFGAATLDGFRASGVSRVGTVAERAGLNGSPGLARDAKSKTVFPSRRVTRVERGLQRMLGGGGVAVITAEDDRVCPECEEISEEGPYTLDEAESLIPAHPNCRCAFVPAEDVDDSATRDSVVLDHIVRLSSGQYRLLSHTGKNLGTFATREEAAKHEGEVEWFKANDAVVQDYDPDQPRDDHGMWSSVGGADFKSWQPPQKGEWNGVEGQDHNIDEPPLPKLSSYKYKDKQGRVVEVKQRLSSGVIMREPDGRTWLVKPTNGYGGYDWTFPKGGVDEGLHPQANAIKEAYEETGLKARITGWAGDYKGDTSVTRMYHAVRAGGHPKDKGWETEQVALAHPDDMLKMLNRSRDKKIAAHHVLGDEFNPNEPRNEQGEWTVGGGVSIETKISNVMSGVASKGYDIGSDVSHYPPGTHGAKQVEGAHSFEVSKEAVGEFNNQLAQHGLAATEHKELGGLFNTYSVKHAGASQPAATDNPKSIHMPDLTKVSGKMGSNEGGVYKDVLSGDSYYVKQPLSEDHVKNELLAAKLYQLAGVKTFNYVPVQGGKHVATDLEKLDKDNVSQLSLQERTQAKDDFAVHAWLANWDAAGTGGDNIGVRKNGEVVTLDTGGSLKYRAQGEPKGAAFGDVVTETSTLRDPTVNPDAAALYGDMTNKQMVTSIKRVTGLKNEDITNTVMKNGGDIALAQQLINRKNDLAKQAIKLSVAAPKTILGPNTTTMPQVEQPTPVAQPVFKTKMEHAKHLLMKGTTSNDLKKALGWQAINVPKTAADLGLHLEKTKLPGGKFSYKGTPLVEVPAKVFGTAVPKPPVVAEAPVAAPAQRASAFDPEPGPKKFDLNKPHENFMASLEQHGIPFELSPASDKSPSHIVAVTGNPIQLEKADQIAKFYHPQAMHNGEGEYFFKKQAGEPTPAKHDINTAHGNFKQALENAGITEYHDTEDKSGGHFIAIPASSNLKLASQIAEYHPKVEKVSINEYYVPGEAPAAVTPPVPTFPPPTEAELIKAKKNTKLTAQYVPGAPQNHPEAEKLIAAFNAKYEGKVLSTPEELAEKVNAFKHLQVGMVPLMSAQQKAEQAKAIAAVAEQAAKKAAAAKAEADVVANLHNLPDEEQRIYWLKKQDALSYMSQAQSDLSKYPYLKEAGVTPAEIGYIRAFTGSHSHVNEEMRSGVMSDEVFAFKHFMNEALDKLPKYTGDKVWRKIDLTADQIAKYQPGKNVHWTQFSSTSKNPDTWSGNVHFVIHNPKTGVDVQKISSHPSEAEVIMPADTYYKVLSKNQSGGVTHIEMEEVIPYGKKLKKAA